MPLDLQEIAQKFQEAIVKADSPEQVESIRRDFLGRQGLFNSIFKSLQALSPSEKQKIGEEINRLKQEIEQEIEAKQSAFESKKLSESLKKESEDPTLPAVPFLIGKPHPLTKVLEEVSAIFIGMGFRIAEGPQIESDENNFGSLNIPEDHPARDMHDTFYIKNSNDAREKTLLRTHTSPVQIRVMRRESPPIRIIAPGKVFRHEAIDATHSSVFHQVEGLVVDRAVSFADLKGTLEIFSKSFFGSDVKIRLRPSYFPFVEPGAEVDITCTICRASKSTCPVCKGTGWIEMLGAGMVHPNVFKAVGYDPEQVTGFAFGMGIERIAMIRYGISDMRLFYENHLDFLSQF